MTEAASSCTCLVFNILGRRSASAAIRLIFGDVIGSAVVDEALGFVAMKISIVLFLSAKK
jgi:hypothetical protein